MIRGAETPTLKMKSKSTPSKRMYLPGVWVGTSKFIKVCPSRQRILWPDGLENWVPVVVGDGDLVYPLHAHHPKGQRRA